MWWTDEEWAELVDPELCGMCADAHLSENEHSILVASTEMTHIRLVRNQAHPGYTVVILREHVTDLGQLHTDQLGAFWRDVQRAGRAVAAAFDPRKISYLVMGHRAPHLHCHVFPQHLADDPLRNVNISDGPVYLGDAGMAHSVAAVQKAWHAVA
ncbi:HIT family protein [Microbacterium sp. NPDC087589]|uniref:HIT family protein n=1 Tax=Microbacterium sp. NPDC087589 TaxID=3364191 RepID=UPI003807E89A